MPLFLYISFSLYGTYIHNIRRGPSPFSISSQLQGQWAEPPWGAEPRFELDTASQRSTIWATLHPAVI